jgi:hypothetical protein
VFSISGFRAIYNRLILIYFGFMITQVISFLVGSNPWIDILRPLITWLIQVVCPLVEFVQRRSVRCRTLLICTFRWTCFLFSIAKPCSAFDCGLEQLQWTSRYAAPGEAFSAIEFQDGKLVAVGGIEKEDGTHPLIVVSTNGWDFQTHIFESTNNSFAKIFFAGGRWVAVSWRSTEIAVSSDGNDWLLGNADATFALSSVTFGQGKYLSGTLETDGVFGSSTDAFHWDAFSSPANTVPVAVSFFKDRFIAAGSLNSNDTYPGFIMNSTDTVKWQESAGVWPVHFYTLVATPDRAFVAGYTMGSQFVPGINQIYTSTNATDWTEFGPNVSGGDTFTSFKYLNGRLIGARNNSELDYFSERSNEWKQLQAYLGNWPFNGITHAFHSYFLVGDGIKASSSTLSPCLESLGPTGGDFIFDFQGETGARYRIEISNDVQNWTPWKDFLADAADIEFHYETNAASTVYFRAKAISP